MTGLQGSSSLVPLANQQVASMRRELEAEQENRGQLRSSSPGARYGAPQMGYAQAHGELSNGIMTRVTSCICPQHRLEDSSWTRSPMSLHCRVRDLL